MSIKLTENAVREIKQIVSSQEMDIDKTFVRIGIQSMGCSGPSYAFGLDEETDEQDVLLEQDSIKIVYDKESKQTSSDQTSSTNLCPTKKCIRMGTYSNVRSNKSRQRLRCFNNQ